MMTFEAISKDIASRKFTNLYVFHGEEPYYVDRLTDALADGILEEGQKEFDQSLLYGKDTDVKRLIETAKRYPMLSPHHVVILKEAQEIKKDEGLEGLIDNLPPTTILVLSYKKKLDGRKKWVKKAKKSGVVFQSDSIPSWHMTGWVKKEARRLGVSIDEKVASMLFEFIGDDLHRISNELIKLKTVGEGKEISASLVEKNIGISREYNLFELQDALIARNVVKANRIINYYASNPKSYPIQMVIPALFGFFSKVLLLHAAKSTSADQAAKVLKSRPFYAKKILAAKRNFSYKKCAEIIGCLRTYDLKAKGVGSTGNTVSGELLKEMVYQILH